MTRLLTPLLHSMQSLCFLNGSAVKFFRVILGGLSLLHVHALDRVCCGLLRSDGLYGLARVSSTTTAMMIIGVGLDH